MHYTPPMSFHTLTSFLSHILSPQIKPFFLNDVTVHYLQEKSLNSLTSFMMSFRIWSYPSFLFHFLPFFHYPFQPAKEINIFWSFAWHSPRNFISQLLLQMSHVCLPPFSLLKFILQTLRWYLRFLTVSFFSPPPPLQVSDLNYFFPM